MLILNRSGQQTVLIERNGQQTALIKRNGQQTSRTDTKIGYPTIPFGQTNDFLAVKEQSRHILSSKGAVKKRLCHRSSTVHYVLFIRIKPEPFLEPFHLFQTKTRTVNRTVPFRFGAFLLTVYQKPSTLKECYSNALASFVPRLIGQTV